MGFTEALDPRVGKGAFEQWRAPVLFVVWAIATLLVLVMPLVNGGVPVQTPTEYTTLTALAWGVVGHDAA